MKRNILRAAVAASILGVSGVAFAADDAVVPFSGTVPDGCKLDPNTAIVPGVVALADSMAGRETDRITAHPNETTNGTIGQFTYICSTGVDANLTVNAPTATGPSSTTLESAGTAGYAKGAEIYTEAAATNLIANSVGSIVASNQAAGTYFVTMWVETPGIDIPGGSQYAYDVTINIADN